MAEPKRRRTFLKVAGWGCVAPVVLLLTLVAVLLYVYRIGLGFPDEPAAAVALTLQPQDPGFPALPLDGFDSPYLGHTGSWDGKGGGLFGSSKRPDLDREAAMGLRWTFMPVYWSAMEPDGPVNLSTGVPPAWQALDDFVMAAQARGLNILMQAPVVGGNAGGPPDWAGRREKGKSAPANMRAAAEFAGKLARRYRPGGVLAQREGWGASYGVAAWELDNEPQFYLTNWNGQAGDYAEFVARSAQAIAAEDPQAVILTPSYVAGGGAQRWVEEALGLHGLTGSPIYIENGEAYSIGPWTDVVSFHVYEGMDSRTVGEALEEAMAPFRVWQERHGSGERRGFAAWHTEGNFDFLNITPGRLRAAWYPQFFTRGFAAGAAKLCVMDAQGVAQTAIRTYVELLPHPFPMLEAADEIEVEEGSARVYRHPRAGGGGNVWIVWAANESDGARVRLPVAAGAASVHRLDGAAEELPAADGWLALDLPGGARISPPLLVVDDG